jgi:hypothetical protein
LQSYNSYLAGSAKAGATVSLMPAQPDNAKPAASSVTAMQQVRQRYRIKAAMPDE